MRWMFYYFAGQQFLIAIFGLWGHSTSSHPEVFYKNGVLKNFEKLLWTPWLEPLFDRVAGWRPKTLPKRDSGTGTSC